MTVNHLKTTGLVFIAGLLVFANLNLIKNTFFAEPAKAPPNLKSVVIPTTEQIKVYADSLLGISDLQIIDDPIESNKRIIQKNENTVGFAYIINEEIACPTCSNVNYLLLVDNNYTIKHIIFLRDIIEGYIFIPIDKFEEFSDKFLEMSLLNNDFTPVKVITNPEKHSNYFKQSIIKLQKQARLFYEG